MEALCVSAAYGMVVIKSLGHVQGYFYASLFLK